MKRRLAWALVGGLAACGPGSDDGPDTLAVVSVEPAPHARAAPVDFDVRLQFDRPVRAESLGPSSLWAFGRWSGSAPVDYLLSEQGRVVTLRLRRAFSAGELVTVYVSHRVAGEDGTLLRASGHSWQFWTRAGPSRLTFAPTATLSTRSAPDEPTRAYGGLATDLDADGALDLTTVNEDTADLRVFLNRADGSGLSREFLRPPSPVGRRASPSEASDFDRDGRADVAVANIDEDTVSVLLGRGDGTFGPAQDVAVGRAPRGLAVLDMDGDGDVDVATANAGSGTLSLLENDGGGRFAVAATLDAGVDGEWALSSADMDDDGILDLVVGAQAGQQVVVMAGSGRGTFRRLGAEGAGGRVWMMSTGDVDGDGLEDVVAANSQTGTAAVLLGDGRGGLTRSQTLDLGRFPLASDLGDLDGDSDLDWVVSSARAGWHVLVNEGGRFRLERLFAAPAAASCALLFDEDGDLDLDMALFDEDADLVTLLRNDGP